MEERQLINPNEHVGFLGKTFVDRQEAPVLRIGRREWSRTALVQTIGVGNFRAAGELTTVCRKVGIQNVDQLYTVDPQELAQVKGLGETTIFVAMAVLQAEGFNAKGWWERMAGFKERQVTFRTLKIREKRRRGIGAVAIPTEKQLKEATRKGALLMDQEVPGWYKHVKLNDLRMGSPSLCMLGQVFDMRTELKVAKEMFPELWEPRNPYSGYTRGLHWMTKKLGFSSQYRAERNNDAMGALAMACAGYDTRCFWADEIAKRIAEDENGTSDTA